MRFIYLSLLIFVVQISFSFQQAEVLLAGGLLAHTDVVTDADKSQQTPYVSKVWVSDLGNGSYKNPVLYADYSDPDVCRVGKDYYMVSSSFANTPGLPVLHSRDMINWTIIGHALPQLSPADRFSIVQHGNGVWAPSIRYHNNEFYIYYGDPDAGIYMTKAKEAIGPWSPLVLVKEGKGQFIILVSKL